MIGWLYRQDGDTKNVQFLGDETPGQIATWKIMKKNGRYSVTYFPWGKWVEFTQECVQWQAMLLVVFCYQNVSQHLNTKGKKTFTELYS